MTTRKNKQPHAPLPHDGPPSAWPDWCAIEGWLEPYEADLLWSAACEVPRGGRIVEIGSYAGRSTAALALAARRVGAHVTAIDPRFRPDFIANLEALDLVGWVTSWERLSEPAATAWQGQADLVFFDGEHTEAALTADVRAWWPHIPVGGVLVFHDYIDWHQDVIRVVDQVRDTYAVTWEAQAGSLVVMRRREEGAV